MSDNAHTTAGDNVVSLQARRAQRNRSALEPPADNIEGRLTPGGYLIPETGLPRIRLSTHRASRAWREIARDLEAATDRIADKLAPPPEGVTRLHEPDLDAVVLAWRRVAVSALIHRPIRLQDMRALIGLAAVLSNSRFLYWGLNHPRDASELAFGLLDRAAFSLIYAAEREAEAAQAKRRGRS